MSADPRRTGGAANRGWCDGSPLPLPRPDRPYLAWQVSAYLWDCRRYGIRNADHPTAVGALKVIYAPDEAHQKIVRAELAAQAAR